MFPFEPQQLYYFATRPMSGCWMSFTTQNLLFTQKVIFGDLLVFEVSKNGSQVLRFDFQLFNFSTGPTYRAMDWRVGIDVMHLWRRMSSALANCNGRTRVNRYWHSHWYLLKQMALKQLPF